MSCYKTISLKSLIGCLLLLAVISCNLFSLVEEEQKKASGCKEEDAANTQADSMRAKIALADFTMDDVFMNDGRNFSALPISSDRYQVVLQKGKTYSLHGLAKRGLWGFSLNGTIINLTELFVPLDTEENFTVLAFQKHQDYEQLRISIEIIPVDKSIFGEQDLRLLAHSQDLITFLQRLENDLLFDDLHLQLGEDELAKSHFEWEFQIFLEDSLTPLSIEKQQDGVIIPIEQLQAHKDYWLTVVARSRSTIAGMLSQKLQFITGSIPQKSDR